jgi:hypothetical protein
MKKNRPAVVGAGAVIGALGGLVGLGGAEFRLPLLIGAFQFTALEAVILNKAMSLVVVARAASPLGRTCGCARRTDAGSGASAMRVVTRLPRSVAALALAWRQPVAAAQALA